MRFRVSEDLRVTAATRFIEAPDPSGHPPTLWVQGGRICRDGGAATLNN